MADDPPLSLPAPRSWFVRVARRGGSDLARTMREAEATWFVVLTAMTVVIMLVGRSFPSHWPLTAYVIPLLLAMNVLSVGRMLVLDFVIGICLVFSVDATGLTTLRWAGVGVIVTVALVVMFHVVNRTTLGVGSLRGESMLIDLRDRLASQSQLPTLPRNWYAEAVMRSAGGASFSGDFIVAAKTHQGTILEVAVVDVSGKGINAGTRALLLSGAFGGLLGSLTPAEFLPAANAYLLRQEWSEGFATCVHLALHLPSGDFQVRTAGHPPAVQFHAGSGRWAAHWTEGPVLGVTGAADFTVYQGRMLAGDALLLYTDGLVETPRRDISYGIDKLLGEAERLVSRGFEHGAARLVASVESESDDRAMLLLHRR